MPLVACNLEELVQALNAMVRPELLSALRQAPCPFKIDFTDDYLATLDDDRLKHLAFAAYLQARKHGRQLA